MKWTSFTLDLSKIRKFVQNLGVLGKTFMIVALCTFLFFLLFGAAGFAASKVDRTPSSSLKGLAASVSNEFFLDAIGLEVPHLQSESKKSLFSQTNIFGFVFRLITDVNPKDPKTLLAREVPGMNANNAILLRKSGIADGSGGPQDYAQQSPKDSGAPTPPAHESSAPTPAPTATPSPEPSPAKKTTDGRKVVMIYHSHNRESFLPELKGIKDPDSAFDSKTNVTLVGKRLADKLEDLGVGAVDYNSDYSSTEKGYNFAYSYKYSQKTVKEAFVSHPDLQFVFDIHRDSLNREKTTTTIGGKDYAQVYFIIGQKNPDWRKNEKFASQIQERLEKSMPGISRGIWGKTPNEGNAEYNQSQSPNSVLIEIGGPYNTLEECYRTADVLAAQIADMYWAAEKVSAPADGKKS